MLAAKCNEVDIKWGVFTGLFVGDPGWSGRPWFFSSGNNKCKSRMEVKVCTSIAPDLTGVDSLKPMEVKTRIDDFRKQCLAARTEQDAQKGFPCEPSIDYTAYIGAAV